MAGLPKMWAWGLRLALAHVTRLWALSDRRGAGRALAEINFRGQRLWKPGGECAVPTPVPGPHSPRSGSRPGARVAVCWGSSPGAVGEQRGGGGGDCRRQRREPGRR